MPDVNIAALTRYIKDLDRRVEHLEKDIESSPSGTVEVIGEVSADFAVMDVDNVWSGLMTKTLSANLTPTIGDSVSGVLLVTNPASYTFSVYGTSFTIRNSGTNGGRTILAYVTHTDGTLWVQSDADNLAKPVTIPIPDVIAPTLVSVIATDANTLELTYSESTSGTTAGYSASNGSAITLASISGAGTVRQITTTTPMAVGQTITLSYNSGTGNTIDTSSNALASITNRAVTNSIVSGAQALAAVINTNADDSRNQLIITYPADLKLTVSSGGAMSSTIPTSAVTVTGKTVTAVTYIGTWKDATVYYCKAILVTVNSAFGAGYTGTVSVNGTSGIKTKSDSVDVAPIVTMAITDYGLTASGTSSTVVLDDTAATYPKVYSESPGYIGFGGGNSSLGYYYGVAEAPYLNTTNYAPFDVALGARYGVDYQFVKGIEPKMGSASGSATMVGEIGGVVVGYASVGTGGVMFKIHPNTTGTKTLRVYPHAAGYYSVDLNNAGSGGASTVPIATIWS